MINLVIHQPEIAHQIFYIINQLSLRHYDNKGNMPFSINIKYTSNALHISPQNSKEIKIQLPCRADKLLDNLENIAKTFYFTIYDLIYYPIDQKLKRSDKIIKLNLIHNNILKYLCLSPDGFPKSEIYKIIWPNDKDYQVNKLDTHITNLKNLILKELDLNFIFESSSGILKINN